MNHNLPDIRSLMKEFNIVPKKSLGQNFLIDQSALQKISEAADITPDAEILEVGPGLGSLTCLLAQSARRVVTVELDKRMLPPLAKALSGFSNVRVVQGDILKLDPGDLMEENGYGVVANIPYYITSALIRHLLEARKKPARLVLTVQREVADRICAKPGDMSLLALSVQVYGQPKITSSIPAEAFFPAPTVDSSTLRVDMYPQPLIESAAMDTFFKLAKAGFSQKRKMLRNSLTGGLRISGEQVGSLLQQAGIDPMRRAETLSIEEWGNLVKEYSVSVK